MINKRNETPDYSPAMRRRIIIETLNNEGEIKVVDLSRRLNISVVTIRKDLDELEQNGFLKRVHGGAIKNYKTQQNTLLSDNMNTKREEKLLIAEATSALINEGDSVIINVGSTSLYTAQKFHEKNKLIVITNALQVFNEIAYYKNITTFFLGGRFDPYMQFTYGDDTIEQLSKYTADKLIIGMDGVDLEYGATSYNHAEDTVMRLMMERSKEKILIADDSKLGKVAFAHIAPLSSFDTFVTNYSPEHEQYYENIRALGLKVIVATP